MNNQNTIQKLVNLPNNTLNAKMLNTNSNEPILQEIIKDQIKIIDVNILAAHDSGFNKIEYVLPINFVLNNMSKTEAQIIVYSELINVYSLPEPHGKGFQSVFISLSPTPTLKISWNSTLSKEDKIKRLNIIKSHIK